ncbi:MAG: hypothetical protein M1505_01605 [Patescibacteria group bacterium]|nr:hypothetical protein [Patescibacteria group bacterium]
MKKIFLILTLAFCFFLLTANLSFAFLTFGGRIISIAPCLNGLDLTLTLPRPGNYLFPWGARLYEWYAIRPGVWLLGQALPGGACLIPAPWGVMPIPTAYTILFTGTSLW